MLKIRYGPVGAGWIGDIVLFTWEKSLTHLADIEESTTRHAMMRTNKWIFLLCRDCRDSALMRQDLHVVDSSYLPCNEAC
jgi:hypothetical protein